MSVGVVGVHLTKKPCPICQGKMKFVREMSGNFDISSLWQPYRNYGSLQECNVTRGRFALTSSHVSCFLASLNHPRQHREPIAAPLSGHVTLSSSLQGLSDIVYGPGQTSLDGAAVNQFDSHSDHSC